MSITICKQYNIDGSLKWKYVIERVSDNIYKAIIFYFSEKESSFYKDFFYVKTQDGFYTYKKETLVNFQGMPIQHTENTSYPIVPFSDLSVDKWEFGIKILETPSLFKMYKD